MSRYRIYDINNGLFAEEIEVEANSPKEATIKAGYKNIKRQIERTVVANLVVYGERGSYCYSADKTKGE
jgi:hypothetical protein